MANSHGTEMTPNQAPDSTKPSEREKLLPCPFCGEPSDLTVHVYGNGDDDAYVQCRECTTCGPDGGDRAGAIAKWNYRALLAADGRAGGEVVAYGLRDKNGGIVDCITPAEHDREPGKYNVPLFTTRPQQEQAAPGAVQDLLSRAEDLHEKAWMPWQEAEKLALSEVGIGDAQIDELIGNCTNSALTTLLPEEDVREFTRAALVYGQRLLSAAPMAVTPDGWMPIETAPKTTKSILVHCSEMRNTYVVAWSHTRDGGEGWVYFCPGNYMLIEEPTHWMPLPAAPKAQEPGA